MVGVDLGWVLEIPHLRYLCKSNLRTVYCCQCIHQNFSMFLCFAALLPNLSCHLGLFTPMLCDGNAIEAQIKSSSGLSAGKHILN